MIQWGCVVDSGLLCSSGKTQCCILALELSELLIASLICPHFALFKESQCLQPPTCNLTAAGRHFGCVQSGDLDQWQGWGDGPDNNKPNSSTTAVKADPDAWGKW